MLLPGSGLCRGGRGGSGFFGLFALLVLFLPAPGHAQPPVLAPEAERADRILVLKAERRLILYRGQKMLAGYDIALGRNPLGHKLREGDGRTPEGKYRIDWRNPQSRYHLSLHVSYPNPDDRVRAEARGENPGGMIMIHGLPNGFGQLSAVALLRDCTEGCIAVTNDAIAAIWRRVPDGALVEIRP